MPNKTTTQYQPKTGVPCSCKRGVQRDNCPTCEGTGQVIDFAAIRARGNSSQTAPAFTPGPYMIKVERGIRYIMAGSRVVATAESLEDGVDNAARNQEADANARLLAAAPALYEAAKAVLEVYAYHKQGSIGAIFDGPLPEAQREQLRAALAAVDAKN